MPPSPKGEYNVLFKKDHNDSTVQVCDATESQLKYHCPVHTYSLQKYLSIIIYAVIKMLTRVYYITYYRRDEILTELYRVYFYFPGVSTRLL